MDRAQGFASDDLAGSTHAGEADCAIEAPPSIGTDERRMHVRAYNHWVTLLGDRTYPSVEDLDPEALTDFGPQSVLLDFTGGNELPAIAWLGHKLRTECWLSEEIDSVAQVPPRSLLSRLTDHHLQIIANRAPIGFEAEFVNARGFNTFYRGILLPFSSDDDTIDFIYGVINWKEVASTPELENEVRGALATVAPRAAVVPVWADGPSAATRAVLTAAPELLGGDVMEVEEDTVSLAAPMADDEALSDRLASARACADAVLNADNRSRAALYGALAQAYDFALLTDTRPQEYSELLVDSGIVAQARAPMTPVVKLIFGTGYDKTRLTEFAAALTFAKKRELPAGGMRLFLDSFPGGLKAIVGAERRERRPEGKVAKPDLAREQARLLAEQAYLTLEGDDEFVILVARRIDPGRVAVIGVVPDDKAMLDRALRQIVE